MVSLSRATRSEKKTAAKVEKAVLSVLGQSDIFVVYADVASEDEIRTLNRDSRGVDSVTDVLSFPAFEGLRLPAVKADFTAGDFDGGRVALGDIMICRARAEEQAERFGHSYEREFGYLLCHGLLHLFGFDHIQPDEEKIMTEAAERIMSAAGITRDFRGGRFGKKRKEKVE